MHIYNCPGILTIRLCMLLPWQQNTIAISAAMVLILLKIGIDTEAAYCMD